MILGILSCLLAAALSFQPSFRRLSTEEGLSQVTVHCITQDNSGRIWMGTGDGLNCFMGHSWATYRHNDDNPSSIAGDEINELYTDTEGKVWVFTSSGLSVCDPDRGGFRTVDPGIDVIHSCLDLRAESPDSLFLGGKFLVCSREGVFSLDKDGCSLVWKSPGTVNAICKSGGFVYAAIPRVGVFRLDAEGAVNIFPTDGMNLSKAIHPAPGGSVWIGYPSGLYNIGPDGSVLTRYGIEDGLSSTIIRSLEYDSDGRLWVGTANNISVILPGGAVRVLRHDPRNRESLSGSSVHCVFRDSCGGMWVGTFYGGASYWHPLRNAPHRIILPEETEGRDAVIRSLGTDPQGRLWVGTSLSGTLVYDSATESAGYLERPVRGREQESAINAICFDATGRTALLGRSFSGITIIGKNGLRRDVGGLDWVFSIEPYGREEYLVGTQRGVYVYNHSNGDLYLLSESTTGSKRVYYAKADSSRLWTGYRDYLSLSVLSRGEDGRLKAVEKESYADIPTVQSIVFTPGRKWFASTSGLFCFEAGSGLMSSKGVKDGWPTNLMRGIEADDSGRLWVSTENGIVLYDPERESTRIWGVRDGLRSTKFNPYAHCKGPDGTLYFGGITGVYSFRPDAGTENRHSPRPLITGIYVNGEAVDKGNGRLNLKYMHRNIDFTVDVPDYISGEDCSVEYRMEGVDEEWRRASVPLKATYTNIPKGTHRFSVRSMNRCGVYCDTPCSVEVTMKPVWYRTLLFEISFCALLLLLIVFEFVRREKQSRSELLAVRRKAQEDISKVRAGSLAKRPLSQKENDFIVKVLEIVDRNISNELFGVQELASAMGMSRSNLNIRLRPITDLSPLDIIRKMRMELAYGLLSSKKYSVAEVAQKSGFNSATYFATSFKKETGMSPSEWMERN